MKQYTIKEDTIEFHEHANTSTSRIPHFVNSTIVFDKDFNIISASIDSYHSKYDANKEQKYISNAKSYIQKKEKEKLTQKTFTIYRAVYGSYLYTLTYVGVGDTANYYITESGGKIQKDPLGREFACSNLEEYTKKFESLGNQIIKECENDIKEQKEELTKLKGLTK